MTTPDPDLKRPYQLLYSAGVQQELLPGLSGSFNYYYRKYYHDFWVDNLVTTHADYTRSFRSPIRAGNGETITVYSIAPGQARRDRQLPIQLHGERSRVSRHRSVVQRAAEAMARSSRAAITTGKLHEQTCQVDDPNNLRYCDATYPFLTQFKLSGTYPLPYGFRLSGLFQSLPGVQSARDGGERRQGPQRHLLGRPGDRAGLDADDRQRPPLNEPGTVFLDRVNQVDFAVSRDFRMGRMVECARSSTSSTPSTTTRSRRSTRVWAEPAAAAEHPESAADSL